ncbi:hypothetical protein [Ferrimonas senticii]|nr:hypothetical protein [Ferrimonas senticii]
MTALVDVTTKLAVDINGVAAIGALIQHDKLPKLGCCAIKPLQSYGTI